MPDCLVAFIAPTFFRFTGFSTQAMVIFIIIFFTFTKFSILIGFSVRVCNIWRTFTHMTGCLIFVASFFTRFTRYFARTFVYLTAMMCWLFVSRTNSTRYWAYRLLTIVYNDIITYRNLLKIMKND